MSEQLCIKDSEFEGEFESESQSSASDSEYQSDSECDSFDSDSDCNGNNAKRRKTRHSDVTEELLTDHTGHIMWYTGQRLKSFEIKCALA